MYLEFDIAFAWPAVHDANVIVFIRAIDHVITMFGHVTRKRGWRKHDRFHPISIQPSQQFPGEI